MFLRRSPKRNADRASRERSLAAPAPHRRCDGPSVAASRVEGRVEKTLRYWKEAKSAYVEFHATRGELAEARGEHDAAVSAYEQYLKTAPHDAPNRKSVEARLTKLQTH